MEGVLYPLCAIATLGSIPPLVQFQKVAEYCQVRDEKQNCFCGIFFHGISGKDPGNPHVWTDPFKSALLHTGGDGPPAALSEANCTGVVNGPLF